MCLLNFVVAFEVAANTESGDSTANTADEVTDNNLASGLETLPQLEFGIAGAALQVPAYPASGVTNDRQFLVPWFIYRSDSVQVKDGGVELVAYESERLKVDLGISGSLNADTSDTPLREGMPDLDFLLELGPRFNVPLSDKTNNGIRARVNWVTSLRLAVSTDFRRLDSRGPVLNTELRYRMDGFNNDKLSFTASVNSTWLGNELMDYFFAVDSEFVTQGRAEFNARGGFLNVGASLGISYDITRNIGTFIGLGYKSFNGSENEDSPLFEDDSTTSVIIAASWRLYESKKMISVREE